MTKTISEKLQDRIGKKVECSVCHKRKCLTYRWGIHQFKAPVCPTCQPKVVSQGGIIVSI